MPIIVKIETEIKPITSDYRMFINFKKADWTRFQTETETDFSKLTQPTNIHKGEQAFRKIINKTAKRTILAGRIKTILPEVPTEAAEKMKERDELRQSNPTDNRLHELNREIESIKHYPPIKTRQASGRVNFLSTSFTSLPSNKNFGTCPVTCPDNTPTCT